MKIAIFGAGMLGKQVYMDLKEKYQTMLYFHDDVDISSFQSIYGIIKQHDVIINCAAYTNVDGAQQECKKCYEVNAVGPMQLALAVKSLNKKLIHISSDFVYGNSDRIELSQTTECTPINAYGDSKLKGQKSILQILKTNYIILRVAWTFGQYGKNFISKISERLLNEQNIEVVSDQIGRPTSTKLIVSAIKKYIDGYLNDGIYNLTNSGDLVSKYQLSEYIKKQLNKENTITPILTDNSGKKYAKRQLNSNLNCTKIDAAGFIRTDWKKDLKSYLNQNLL